MRPTTRWRRPFPTSQVQPAQFGPGRAPRAPRVVVLVLGHHIPNQQVVDGMRRLSAAGAEVDLVSWRVPDSAAQALSRTTIVVTRPPAATREPGFELFSEQEIDGDPQLPRVDVGMLPVATLLGTGGAQEPPETAAAAPDGPGEDLDGEPVAELPEPDSSRQAADVRGGDDAGPGHPWSGQRLRRAAQWRIRRERRRLTRPVRLLLWHARRVARPARRKLTLGTRKIVSHGHVGWHVVRRRDDVRELVAQADVLVAFDVAAVLTVWHYARRYPHVAALSGVPAALNWLATSQAES